MKLLLVDSFENHRHRALQAPLYACVRPTRRVEPRTTLSVQQ
jgi:hypothetical protein